MTTPAHSSPLDPLVEAIARRVAELVREERPARVVVEVAEGGLDPDASYDYAATARFLGIKRESVYKVPESMLPRETGVQGRVRGVDILAYRGDITREEARAYKAATRARVLRLIKSAGEAA